MPLQLPDLPYNLTALEPHMSRRTLEFHHGKHHKAYVDNTNAAVKGTPLENADIVTIIRSAKSQGQTKLFNNSAQVWNHTFFWNGVKAGGGEGPIGEVAKRIEADFGGFEAFKKTFAAEATGHFASGWAWLVVKDGRLALMSTHDADTPVVHAGVTPLLTADVWEHAYYLDYQNARGSFIEAFLTHLINWEEVERRYHGRS
jgi:superoxide dismutase, Fe-Mn family